MRWLIAEDETDIRNLVAMMCQVWGHAPMPFETGQKVWDWLDEVDAGKHSDELPEFALMDIRMPGKRGNEIAQRLRQTDSLKHIPIVLMTAFVLSDDERREMMEDSGVDRIINKPLPDLMQLHQILHEVINTKQANNP